MTDIRIRINYSRMSPDEERVKDIEAKWAAESEDRIDAFDRGELQTIDGPSALRDLRVRFRNNRDITICDIFQPEILEARNGLHR